jgi:Carboxypeptidase regulatory-like domain
VIVYRCRASRSYTLPHLLTNLQQFRSQAVGCRRAILWLSSIAVLLTAAAPAAEIRGKVSNASGGEALGQVQVQVVQSGTTTITAVDGTFQIQNLDPGAYTLRLNAAGFRLTAIPVVIAEGTDVKELTIAMAPDNFRRVDTVEVKGDPFYIENESISQENLTGTEIRQTATVLVDDPFRAVQTLPGVSAAGNNEFFAEFSVMGAPFRNVAVYIDDVVVSRPFHELPGFSDGASLSVLTSETIEEMNLMPVAYPERYGDAVGAALDVRTRDGSRAEPLFRLTAGMGQSDFLGEGQLGNARRGSWLFSVRKSYIGYLLKYFGADTDVGFTDARVKLTYDLTPRHNVNLFAVGGHTDVFTSAPSSSVPSDDFKEGNNDFTLARVGWRFAAAPAVLLDSHAAYIRQAFDAQNPFGQKLQTDYYQEWVGGTNLVWSWQENQLLQAGWVGRHLRENGYSASFFNTGTPELFSLVDGSAFQQRGYLQQSSALLGNRLHLLGGMRFDALQRIGVHPVSPQFSLSFKATSSTSLQLGYGQYAQFFPGFSQVPVCPVAGLLPERSQHYVTSLEQKIGEHARFRVEAFDRENRHWLGERSAGFSPAGSCALEPLSLSSSVFQHDRSRGLQFVLQRRSANRLSGWVGYTLAYSDQRFFPVSLAAFGGNIFTTGFNLLPETQRHTVNVFGAYRLTPTVNVSGKWIYGSGFSLSQLTFRPVGTIFVPTVIPVAPFQSFQRLDLRASKSWAFTRSKLTLYGEVLNLTNRENRRILSVSIGQNGEALVRTDKGVPIAPAVGLAFEF